MESEGSGGVPDTLTQFVVSKRKYRMNPRIHLNKTVNEY